MRTSNNGYFHREFLPEGLIRFDCEINHILADKAAALLPRAGVREASAG
ncbi:hypothetical protein BN871_AF_00010 [Paenibacillus sp. P22]|nr:hypothetical protein BN871_AF_00010 [Paenibacillus sp. P22]